jgi:hypothetical protein
MAVALTALLEGTAMTFDGWFQEQGWAEEHRDVFRIVWDAATKAEREACAKLCDELDNGENSGDYASAARWCAARIRAR